MKKFLIGLFAVITFVPALAYFVSCLTPFISPVHFWPMAFLALGFPYLAPVIFILALCWIFVNRKVGTVMFVLFFAGFPNLFATFALNPSPASPTAKATGLLRILTWNVRGFDNPSAEYDSINSIRRQMFDYISRVDPDVLCLQEFSEHYVKGCLSNTTELQKRGYRYFYKTDEIVRNHYYGGVLSGTAIFSKIPLADTGKVMLGDPSYPEYLAFADVALGDKPIRVFATHFKSINLFAGPVDTANKVIFYGDTDFVYHATKFEKLKSFAQAHAKEAVIVKQELAKSPFPVILATDMNSVPTSYQYHLVSSNLQDAFKLNGWGLGTTMADLPKTLRIDFLLVDQKLSIVSYRKDDLRLSDHFPQFVDISWKNN